MHSEKIERGDEVHHNPSGEDWVVLRAGVMPNKRLAALLDQARERPVTENELQEQRQSWVRGEMAIGLDRDEAAYRDAQPENPDADA